MVGITIRRKSRGEVEIGRSTGNGVQHRSTDDRTDHLRYHVGKDEAGRKSTSTRQSNSYCRIEVAPRNVSDGIGHREHCKTESEGHAEQSNTDMGKSSRDHRTAATAKCQPECADCFGRKILAVHHSSPRSLSFSTVTTKWLR